MAKIATPIRFFLPYRRATILIQPNINHAPKYRTHAQISIHTPKYWTHTQISIHSPKYGTHTQIPTTCSISWCDNLVPNVYGTEVFLTCSLHDAQDVIIFQVEWFSSFEALQYLLFIGPESDHWQCLSVTDWLTHSLTHCRLVNFIDVSLACEDGNSKLVEVVTIADVDA